MNFKINSVKKIILVKLLRNVLITLSVVWAGVLIFDSILAGLISSQISFLKLTLTATILLSIIYFLTGAFELKEMPVKSDNKIITTLPLIFAVLILTLSLLDFNAFSITIITTASLLTLFYFHKELLKSNKRD